MRGGFKFSLAVAMVLTAIFVTAQPALADRIVTGCHRSFCIDVSTGSKNYNNRTQWVGEIYVYLGNDRVEAWADGFYAARNGHNGRWCVCRWVRSGTYVCGATNQRGRSERTIACISIRV